MRTSSRLKTVFIEQNQVAIAIPGFAIAIPGLLLKVFWSKNRSQNLIFLSLSRVFDISGISSCDQPGITSVYWLSGIHQFYLCISVIALFAEYELPHDKSKKKNDLCAQQRLRSAWASAQSDQSSLCALWEAKDPTFLHAHSEGSNQTGRMPRLIWVFAWRTGHPLRCFVGPGRMPRSS